MVSKTGLKTKKVLISCGPTWVAIDDTRIISNISTGELGQKIAIDLQEKGDNVTLLEGAVLKPLQSKSIKILKYKFFDELKILINQELKKHYDIFIHLAAVSDYTLEKPFKEKLSSKLKTLTLKLKPTPKLINGIKKIDPNIFLVGFKLESHLNGASIPQLTQGLFENAKCDLVVANSLKDNKYVGYIVDKKRNILVKAESKQALSKLLIKNIKSIIETH